MSCKPKPRILLSLLYPTNTCCRASSLVVRYLHQVREAADTKSFPSLDSNLSVPNIIIFSSYHHHCRRRRSLSASIQFSASLVGIKFSREAQSFYSLQIFPLVVIAKKNYDDNSLGLVITFKSLKNFTEKLLTFS